MDNVLILWAVWIISHCPVIEFNGRPLLIGDGIKVSKEGRKMAAVKSLHQSSNNNSKKGSISGHHFGFVGLLIGSAKKAFCIPLQGEIQEGVNELHLSKGLNGGSPTLVTRMARLLIAKAKSIGRCSYAVVDAYFAVGSTFLILKEELNENKEQWVHLQCCFWHE